MSYMGEEKAVRKKKKKKDRSVFTIGDYKLSAKKVQHVLSIRLLCPNMTSSDYCNSTGSHNLFYGIARHFGVYCKVRSKIERMKETLIHQEGKPAARFSGQDA